MISALRIRTARACLVWDRRDLSRKAVVPLGTIEQLETGTKVSGTAMTSTLATVKAAREAEGIEFTGGRRARRPASSKAGHDDFQKQGHIMDIPSIEREYRRIVKSRRSMVEMTKMADGLFQRISAFYGTLNDETAKSAFRSAYNRLAETTFGVPPARSDTNSSRLAALMLDHSRNLKEVEATIEKLNEQLGDF